MATSGALKKLLDAKKKKDNEVAELRLKIKEQTNKLYQKVGRFAEKELGNEETFSSDDPYVLKAKISEIRDEIYRIMNS